MLPQYITDTIRDSAYVPVRSLSSFGNNKTKMFCPGYQIYAVSELQQGRKRFSLRQANVVVFP